MPRRVQEASGVYAALSNCCLQGLYLYKQFESPQITILTARSHMISRKKPLSVPLELGPATSRSDLTHASPGAPRGPAHALWMESPRKELPGEGPPGPTSAWVRPTWIALLGPRHRRGD